MEEDCIWTPEMKHIILLSMCTKVYSTCNQHVVCFFMVHQITDILSLAIHI